MRQKKISLIFVETSEEALKAIYISKNDDGGNETIILASTPVSQNILARQNMDFTSYSKFLPNEAEIKKIHVQSNKFAVDWFLNTPMATILQTDGNNLAYYLVGYWTNLLIPLITSRYIINKAIKFYKPTQIRYFVDKVVPEKDKNADNYVITKCGYNIVPHKVKIKPIPNINSATKGAKDLPIAKFAALFKYKATDFPMILKIIFLHYLYAVRVVKPRFKKADILIYSDTYHLTNSIPLIMGLQKHFSVQVLGALLSLDQRLTLTKAGISYEIFENIEPVNPDSRKLSDISNGLKSFLVSKEYFALLKKLDLTELEPTITQGFLWYFERHFPSALSTLTQTTKIINLVRPNATLLFGNYGKKGLSLCYATQNNGGRVFILEHGIFADPDPVQIHPPIYDYMLFWGKWSRDHFYRSFHESLKKLYVVGLFLTDNIFESMENYKKISLQRSEMKISDITALLLTTYDYYSSTNQLKMLSDTVNTLYEIGVKEVIIRPHPGEGLPQDMIFSVPREFKITWDLGEDLDSQIKKSDIVISEGTSVALRVMMWGKPLIHLMTENVVDVTNFSKYGAAIEIKNIKDLPNAIKILTHDKSARKKMLAGQSRRLVDFCYKMDGRATNRVVDFVREKAFANE